MKSLSALEVLHTGENALNQDVMAVMMTMMVELMTPTARAVNVESLYPGRADPTPPSFQSQALSALEVLHTGENGLQSLPPSLAHLPRLHTLTLNDNRLQQVKEGKEPPKKHIQIRKEHLPVPSACSASTHSPSTTISSDR
jgi:hypothetical protein